MKKILSFICIILLIFSSVSCSAKNIAVSAAKAKTTTSSTQFNKSKSTTTKKASIVKKTTNTKKTTQKKVTVDTKKYKNEIKMLAKLVYREARGVKSKAQQAAVIWCVLNRVDTKGFPNTISKVITQKSQFAWNSNTPVKKEFEKLAEDVVKRWLLEKKGQKNVGRTLPKSYLYFYGDGKKNYFRKTYKGKATWNWSLPSPY